LARNLRASLLVAEGGSADPLASGRARGAFFATHPNATYYADFRDFTFAKLHVDYVRYIGGLWCALKDVRFSQVQVPFGYPARAARSADPRERACQRQKAWLRCRAAGQ
jgi:hypothetical protein